MYYKQYSKFMHAEESDGSIAWARSCMIAGSQFWSFFCWNPLGRPLFQ